MAKKTKKYSGYDKTVIINGDPLRGMSNGSELALISLATKITASAKVKAPVDLGELKNSIMYKAYTKEDGFNDSGGKQASSKITPKPKVNEAYVGSNTLHSVYQELGTRKQVAQPFLRPAVIEVKGEAIPDIKKTVDKAMDKELSKSKTNDLINELLR